MALINRASTAPVFTPTALAEDSGGADVLAVHPANGQFLGHQAAHHPGQVRLGEMGNRVSDASFRAISTRDTPPAASSADAASPLGLQRARFATLAHHPAVPPFFGDER